MLDRAKVESGPTPASDALQTTFEGAMDDDFNTPVALVALNKSADAALSQIDNDPTSIAGLELLTKVRDLMSILGLFVGPVEYEEQTNTILKYQAGCYNTTPLTRDGIVRLIEERNRSRDAGNFARSDEIRDALYHSGIKLLDSRGKPTTWQFSVQAK